MQPKTFGKRTKGKKLEKIASSKYFENGVFKNPVSTSIAVNPLRIMKDYATSNSSLRKPSKNVPLELLTKSSFSETPSIELAVRWLGHASTIIEIDGKRILTDAVFSNRVSPFSFMGPKRLHPSPIDAAELPKLDAIIISHNHYDHMDYEFIQTINDTDIPFIVPLGVGSYLEHWGILEKNITELDWHNSIEFESLKITATPARHFTGRGLLDRNKSHWASFVIEGVSQKIFFCGDSGFFDGFKNIGEQYGPFDITMIGIGAYNEQWQAIHTNPAEAIQAHKMLNGKYLLPIHWCTFDLALHKWMEPIDWLIDEATKNPTDLIVPIPGRLVKAVPTDLNQWWK